MKPTLWIFDQMGRVWAHSPMMLDSTTGHSETLPYITDNNTLFYGICS